MAFLIQYQIKMTDRVHGDTNMIFDDKLLIGMYVEYNITCDRLVSNPAVLQRFSQDYSGRIGKDVEPANLSHHLLNLRRLGEKSGGLPRLRRNYNGRN